MPDRLLRVLLLCLTLLATAACRNGAASSGEGDTPVDASDALDAADAADGHPLQRRPDGAWCPAGQIWAQDLGGCVGVGPHGCADTVLTDPASCVPLWCGDWRDRHDQACSAGSPGCALVGRACRQDEVAAGLGCPAGQWPDPVHGGSCVPAGWLGTVPLPGAATSPEALVLPDELPRWCWDLRTDTGAACPAQGPDCRPVGRTCTGPERATGAGCAVGEWPNPAYGGVCAPAGYLGSVPLPQAAQPGALPPLPPDETPHWCEDTQGPRPCTFAEVQAGQGCRAGWWRDPLHGGACTPAGWPDSVPLPAAGTPGDLPPLPPEATPRWCGDWRTDAGAACSQDEPGCWLHGRLCTPQELATCNGLSGKGTVCAEAGVPWACPPGFVAAGPTDAATGLPACAPDPADCGPAPFGNVAPGPGVVFVDAAAPAGGDGSLAKPLTELAKAIELAPAGGTVALAAGTYTGGLVLAKPLQIRGRCAALVTVVAPPGQPAVTVQAVPAPGVQLHGLRLTGPGAGIDLGAGGRLQGRRLWLDATTGGGILAEVSGAELDLRDSVVADTQVGPSPEKSGRGLVIAAGARAQVARVRLHRNRTAALTCHGAGSQVHGSKLVIDGTLAAADGGGGRGIQVSDGAQAELSGVAVLGNREVGLDATGPAAEVTVTGLRLSGTEPATGAIGAGALVHLGARLHLRGSRLDHNRRWGLGIASGGRARLESVRIDHTLDDGQGAGGRAVQLQQDGSRLDWLGGRCDHYSDFGVGVAYGSVEAKLRGVLVDSATSPAPVPGNGSGLYATTEPARLVAVGSRVSHVAFAGVQVEQGAHLAATGLVVDHVVGEPFATAGLRTKAGGALDVRASRVSSTERFGVSLDGGTVRLDTVLIDAIRPTTAKDFGDAVNADPADAVHMANVLVAKPGRHALRVVFGPTRVRALGLASHGPGPGLSVTTVPDVRFDGLRISAAGAVAGLSSLWSGGGEWHTNVAITGLLADDPTTTAACQAPRATKLPACELAREARLNVASGAHLHLRATLLVGQGGSALNVGDSALEHASIDRRTTLWAEDVVVRDVRPAADGKGGLGLEVHGRSEAIVLRSRIIRARGAGVQVGSSSRAQLAGVSVEQMQPDSALEFAGAGGFVKEQALLRAAGCRVRETQMVALAAKDTGTRLEVGGCLVQDVADDPGMDVWGVGVAAAFEADLSLVASRVTRAHAAGVSLHYARGTVTDTVVADTLPGPYLLTTGETIVLADGILAVGAPDFAVVRTLSLGHPRAGLLVSGGAGRLEHSFATGNGIGMARQLGAKLTLSTSRWFGNAQDEATDEGLEVPATPPPALMW